MNVIHKSTAAVGYARISKKRSEQTSIASQIKAIEREAARREIPLVQVFVDDGRSAYRGKARRAGYDGALALMAARQADTFIVWAVDRFSRDWSSAGEEYAKIKATGGALVAIVDEVDTSTEMGEIEFGAQVLAAQRESAKKAQRGRAWHAERRDAVLPPAGQPPIGYVKPGPNQLEIDPVIAEIIRAGVAEIVAGESTMRQLVRTLEHAGRSVTQAGLTRTLRAPTIAGLGKDSSGQLVEASWPAVLDRATWTKLGEILSDPARKTNFSRGRRRWALAGIARCGVDGCGGQMRVKPSTKRAPRMMCTRCEQSMYFEPIEQLVADETRKRLTKAKWAELRSQGRGRRIDVDSYQTGLDALDELLDSEAIDEVRYATRVKALKARVEAAAAERIELPDVTDPVAEWERMGPDGQRLIYLAVIESLTIAGGGLQSGSRVNLDRVQLRFVESAE